MHVTLHYTHHHIQLRFNAVLQCCASRPKKCIRPVKEWCVVFGQFVPANIASLFASELATMPASAFDISFGNFVSVSLYHLNYITLRNCI